MSFLKMSALLFAGVLLAGCDTTGMPWSGSSSKSDSSAKVETTSNAAAEKRAEAPKQQHEITDSSKVVAGEGIKVKGLHDWEGEISGIPAANSKFKKLEIGMSMKQVTNAVGEPDDEGAYMTGKAWIPFYFGSDRHRFEMVYKNQGRLIFAGGSMGDFSSGHLIWIIHNAHESGTR
jgi:hypothetical protein